MKSVKTKSARLAVIGAGAAAVVAVPTIALASPGSGSSAAGQVAAHGKTVQAAGPHCDAGWAVKVQRKTKYRKPTGERDVLINKSKRSVKRTYTLTKHATTKWNVSAEASGSFKAWIFAEVNVKIGGGLEKSYSITATESHETSVPPKTTLVVTRGFQMRRVYGNTYYTWSNCKTGKFKSFQLTAPYGRYTAFD
ncbi:hypothetical protein [Actinomadura sp. WMMA1423]|uniref:hypothetical protein n=1 Tax=Actinomadura sp. WMMA1423 TaxID=2591108 RepID=UPI001147937F|nr:hypothetical protein [Actinomadura sp. WMMA1423]